MPEGRKCRHEAKTNKNQWSKSWTAITCLSFSTAFTAYTRTITTHFPFQIAITDLLGNHFDYSLLPKALWNFISPKSLTNLETFMRLIHTCDASKKDKIKYKMKLTNYNDGIIYEMNQCQSKFQTKRFFIHQ